jgi:hypothetical protein
MMSNSTPVQASELTPKNYYEGRDLGFASQPLHLEGGQRLEDALSTSGDHDLAPGGGGSPEAATFMGIVNEDRLTDKQRRREQRDIEKAIRLMKMLITRAKKMEKCAVRLQNWFRGKFARAVAKRMRRRKLFALAAQSGVLLACEGTQQGQSGWYQQTEESIPVYYEVNERGEWKLIC